jgi:hypothetical protein
MYLVTPDVGLLNKVGLKYKSVAKYTAIIIINLVTPKANFDTQLTGL